MMPIIELSILCKLALKMFEERIVIDIELELLQDKQNKIRMKEKDFRQKIETKEFHHEQKLQSDNVQSLHIVSEHLLEYQTYMSNLQSEAIPQQPQLIEFNSASLRTTTSFSQFSIYLESANKHQEVIKLTVQYGLFAAQIKILLINAFSPSHQTRIFSTGSSAKTFKIAISGQKILVKCTEFREDTFTAQLQNTIKEYFLLMIADGIGAGPAPIRLSGFDLLVYKDCIQYGMEFCQQQYCQLEQIQEDLKSNLSALHSIHFIHCDIKPQNICYSSVKKRTVFIDFGLSEIIKQPLGFKSNLKFRGTPNYCSDEMNNLMFDCCLRIDAYYNDLIGLKKSIKQIKILSPKWETYECSFTDQTSHYLMVTMKWLLSERPVQRRIESLMQIIKFSYISWKIPSCPLKDQLQNIILTYDIEQLFNRSGSITSLLHSYQENQLIELLNRRLKHQDYTVTEGIDHKTESSFGQLVLKIEKMSHFIKRVSLQELLADLQNQKKVFMLDQELNHLLFAYMLQLDEQICSFQQKDHLAKIFCHLYAHQIASQSQITQIGHSIKFIFQACFSSKFTFIKLKTIQILVVSIVMLQCLTEQQLIESFNKIIQSNFDVNLQILILILYRYLVSLFWVSHRFITRYSYKKLSFFFWTKTKLYIESHSTQKQANHYINQMASKIIQIPLHFNQLNSSMISFELKYYQWQSKSAIEATLKQRCLADIANRLNKPLSLNDSSIYHGIFSTTYYYFSWAGHENQLNKIYQTYHRMFSSFAFFKQFNIYLYHQSSNIESYCQLVRHVNYQKRFAYQLFIVNNIQNLPRSHNILTKLGLNQQSCCKFIEFKLKNNHTNYQFQDRHHLHETMIRQVANLIWRCKSIAKRQGRSDIVGECIKLLSKVHQLFMSLISQISCFHCKTLCLLDIHIIQIHLLQQCKQFSRARSLTLELMSVLMKHKKLIYNLQSLYKHLHMIRKEEEIPLLMYETLKMMKITASYFECFYLISQVCYLLFRRSRFDQIGELIACLAFQLEKKKDEDYSKKCMQQFQMFLNSIVKEENWLYLLDKIQIIIKVLKVVNIPYLSFFYVILFKFNFKSLYSSLLCIIANNLNKIDPLSRQLILETYYFNFYDSFQCLSRKVYILHKFHIKHQRKKENIMGMLILKLKLKYAKKEKNNSIHFTSIQKYIQKYGMNLAG